MTNDEHHDERYEDGDMSTGTVADYEDWLGDDPPPIPVQFAALFLLAYGLDFIAKEAASC